MKLTSFSIAAAAVAVYLIIAFILKKKTKSGFVTESSGIIRKDYKFVKVEFKGDLDGFTGIINTQNPFFISNLTHLFDSVQNDGESTKLKKSTMRIDSPDFDKWLKTFDETLIQLELIRQ